MLRSRAVLAACAALALAAAAPVRAHDTWLSPETGTAAGGPVRFHLTSGGAFPATDHGIEARRVARAHLRLAGSTVPLAVEVRRTDVLVLRAPAAAPGLATSWVALHPRTLTLTPALVDEYLREIGEYERLAPRWAAMVPKKTWRETYRKHAKAFLALGDAARADESWREAVGLDLEIVPETSPASLAEGDTLRVRVLKQGAPAEGLPLRAARQGSPGRTQRTDAEGRASFTLDAGGPWLVAGTDLRESTTRPGEWDSDFTTLTFEVAPRRRNP